VGANPVRGIIVIHGHHSEAPHTIKAAINRLGGSGTRPREGTFRPDDTSKIVDEKGKSSHRTWARLTGRAKVLNAYARRADDGAEVDLPFATDAPGPGQEGLSGR
jgi:hypothetical protein